MNNTLVEVERRSADDPVEPGIHIGVWGNYRHYSPRRVIEFREFLKTPAGIQWREDDKYAQKEYNNNFTELVKNGRGIRSFNHSG